MKKKALTGRLFSFFARKRCKIYRVHDKKMRNVAGWMRQDQTVVYHINHRTIAHKAYSTGYSPVCNGPATRPYSYKLKENFKLPQNPEPDQPGAS